MKHALILLLLCTLVACSSARHGGLTIDEQHARLKSEIEQYDRTAQATRERMADLRARGEIDKLRELYAAFTPYRQVFDSGDIIARRDLADAFRQLKPNDQARFHFTTLDLRQPAASGCNIAAMAIEDTRSGHFNLLRAGMPSMAPEEQSFVEDFLLMKYGIRRFLGQSCNDGQPYYDLVEAYNAEVCKQIEKARGIPMRDIWDEAMANAELRMTRRE